VAEDTPPPDVTVLWPNQKPVVDGVVPDEEISQDPDLFKDEDDLDLEMED